MYFLVILFFGSLIGITFMIGRKLIMIQNGLILNKEDDFLKAPYLEELKYTTIKNIKKYGYTGVVTIIRLYVRSTNLLKNKYQEIKIKVKNVYNKNLGNNSIEKKEVSKFLKMIGEYKHKIREIKHKVKEEEENL